MPFAIRDLGDGRLLIVGAVPGDGLLAAVNQLRGDLEHAIIVDRKELIDELRSSPIKLGVDEPAIQEMAHGEAVQVFETGTGPQDGQAQQLHAHLDEADRRRQILGF